MSLWLGSLGPSVPRAFGALTCRLPRASLLLLLPLKQAVAAAEAEAAAAVTGRSGPRRCPKYTHLDAFVLLNAFPFHPNSIIAIDCCREEAATNRQIGTKRPTTTITVTTTTPARLDSHKPLSTSLCTWRQREPTCTRKTSRLGTLPSPETTMYHMIASKQKYMINISFKNTIMLPSTQPRGS